MVSKAKAAAQLESVDARVVEKAIAGFSGESKDISATIKLVEEREKAEAARNLERAKALKAVTVNADDVKLLQTQFGLSQKAADLVLREEGGSLVAAQSKLLQVR